MKQVHLLVLNRTIESAQQDFSYGVFWWPRPVMATLRDVMQLQQVEGGRYIYVPRTDPHPEGCVSETSAKNLSPTPQSAEAV